MHSKIDTTPTGSILHPFRPDIAGLRAIAVVSVVLCHLKIAGFDGGFVGVDIFFVISGYLISRNILSGLAQGRFSFADFYLRRARRILPALLFTIAVTFLCGMLWLSPDLLRQLAKESTHALLSIANIQYWRESNDYFAATAEQLPLLHCWSLSLEEQFYLVWPALLVAAARARRVGIAIALAASLSFAFALIMQRHDAAQAFYLMPFRIFEFSLGALVIFAERRGPRLAAVNELLVAGGLGAIALSIALFDAATPFPGWATLVPCLGTAAVICGGSRTRTSRLICHRLARALGAISYSLYLCHWPIIFFTIYIFGPGAMTVPVKLTLIVGMLLMATIMYSFIEQPFRGQTAIGTASRRHRKVALQYTAAVLLPVLISHTAFLQNGWAWRLPPAEAQLAELQAFGGAPCDPQNIECVFGSDKGAVALELLGDSLAHQYVAAFDPLLRQRGLRGRNASASGCPMLVGTMPNDEREPACRQNRDAVLKRLQSTNANLLFAQAWDLYSDARTTSDFARPDLPAGEVRSIAQLEASIGKTVELLATPGRRFLLIGAQVFTSCVVDRTRLAPGPLHHAPPSPCKPVSRAQALQDGAGINAMLARIRERWPDRIDLLLPAEAFCDIECPIIRDGVWLYYNGGHFSVAGARYMAERAQPMFEALLQP